jgi:hypothetical protein
MPIVGAAPVVQMVTSKPSLEERAKALLEGRVVQKVTLERELLTLYLDSGQTLQLFVEGGFNEQ